MAKTKSHSKKAEPKLPKKIVGKNPEIAKLSDHGTVAQIRITCTEKGCDETRIIKPQDAFQVRLCLKHQKKHTRAKLAARRKAAKAEARKEREAIAASRKKARGQLKNLESQVKAEKSKEAAAS
jgi:hypothetical protein